MSKILKLESLSKSYGTVSVLASLDLSVEDGEFLALLGPSGSGKTTVLRLIGGFEEATSGRILLDEKNIVDVPINKRPFHTVFQDYALFPHMTVASNVAYGLSVRGTNKETIRKRVAETLDLVQLSKLVDRLPAQLSGGQRQRVALARAIICQPRLVLLDEPLAALDFELRLQMQQFLKDIQRRIKTTFIFVTHDQEEAMNCADRICVMQSGKIEQIGTAREIYQSPQSEFVARFFGENNLIPATPISVNGAVVKVSTPLGEFVCNSNSATAQSNAEGILAVRPEALKFNSGSTENAFKARVKECHFSGPVISVRLEANTPTGKLEIKVRVPAQSTAPKENDEVTIGFGAADGFLVAR